MSTLTKGVSLGMTTAAIAAIIVVAFLWVGPGIEGFFHTTSASVLFNEQTTVDIYERVSPAVVEVNTTQGSTRNPERMGSGSGFLIDTQGHIVTNNHVVDGADTVNVKFSNGTTANATILGRTPANDMALLKVDASLVEGIQPVTLGDSSQLKPGQIAIAIGNPFGLDGSITVGVISQVGRDLPSKLGRPISDVIQTDALINPGNSGGPLLDSSGAVIGINTAIQVSPIDGASGGIGFAVPIDTLQRLLPRLKTEGLLRPPWLGIQIRDVDAELAERLGLPVDSGIYVVGVAPNGPADEAGLIESGLGLRDRATGGGDVITKVGGVSVDSGANLVAQLNTKRPGDEVTLTVTRGGETLEIMVTLGEWPDNSDLKERRRFERRPKPDDGRKPFDRFSPPPGDGESPWAPFDRFIPWQFRR